MAEASALATEKVMVQSILKQRLRRAGGGGGDGGRWVGSEAEEKRRARIRCSKMTKWDEYSDGDKNVRAVRFRRWCA